MRTEELFQVALSLSPPWYVHKITFDPARLHRIFHGSRRMPSIQQEHSQKVSDPSRLSLRLAKPLQKSMNGLGPAFVPVPNGPPALICRRALRWF